MVRGPGRLCLAIMFPMDDPRRTRGVDATKPARQLLRAACGLVCSHRWCLKVASVSFVERGLARAIFGGSPPESSLAEALKFFTKAQELKPAPKTKALIRLVEKKMG